MSCALKQTRRGQGWCRTAKVVGGETSTECKNKFKLVSIHGHPTDILRLISSNKLRSVHESASFQLIQDKSAYISSLSVVHMARRINRHW